MPGPGKVGHAAVSLNNAQLDKSLKNIIFELEQRRVALNMSERDMCYRAGINRATYRRAIFKEGEHKGMSLRTFLAMCNALYVVPSQIMLQAEGD
jgi:DNA-binding Xre family transcriptional regulator